MQHFGACAFNVGSIVKVGPLKQGERLGPRPLNVINDHRRPYCAQWLAIRDGGSRVARHVHARESLCAHIRDSCVRMQQHFGVKLHVFNALANWGK